VKAYRPDRAENSEKWEEGGSSDTVIISDGGILPIPDRTNHNPKNPATGYDHRIAASTFLLFSGVFPRLPAGNPRNRCPGYVIFSIVI
jgi:hypothetical protein